MNRVLCSAALIVPLLGCAAEKPAAAPQAEAAQAETVQAETAQAETASTTASAAPETAAVPAGHDVTGAYFPMDALPADFAEIEHLLLATIDENAAPAPLNGFLRPKSRTADDYKLLNPTISDRRLTFDTTSHGGVHYAFDGRFEVLGNFPENPPPYETVVLSGTLRCIRDGKTVASTPVRFRYEAGG